MPPTAKVLPDPEKWIAPKKAPPKQRPLVDPKFYAHNGVATPPTTAKKRGGASNRSYTAKAPSSSSVSSSSKPSTRRPRTSDATPTAPIRGIESYMTPKSTEAKKRTTTKKTTAAAAATPASTSENVHRPKRRRSDAADVIDLAEDDDNTPTIPAAAPRMSMTTPLISRSDVRPRTPGTLDPKVDASVAQWMRSLPRKKSKPVDSPLAAPLRTPEVPQSSLIEITPIPADVMARHSRLCGQDARPAGYVSPWRREGLTEEELAAASKAEREERAKQRAEEREHKRANHDVREAVAEKAVRRIEEVHERRARGEFQPLARLSSEDNDGSSSPRRSSSPSDRRALEKSIGRAPVPLQHPASLESKPVSSRNDWPRHRPPPRFPPLRAPARSPVTTPRKSRSASHHHHISPPKVTPPKSRTPRRYGEQQETLFVFPPPRQPVFTKQSVSPEKPIARWQAVEMDPETLMTWSLGGGGGGASMRPSQHEDPFAAEDDAAMRADVPIPLSAIAEDDDDIQSIAPSIPSQSFPNLIDASPSPRRVTKMYAHVPSPVRRLPLSPRKVAPAKESASLHRTSSDTVPSSIIGETVAPARDGFLSPLPSPSPKRRTLDLPPSPPPVPCKRLIRRVGAPPPNMHAFYSSLTSIPMARSDSFNASVVQGSSASLNRNRAAAAAQGESSQSKLESFGYFRDRVSTKKETPAFETAFSDEDDLDFGVDDNVYFSSPPEPTRSRRLVPIPEAPPHPSLRPAGVEAVEKRKAAAMARHREQQESGHGNVVPADDYDDSGPHLTLPPASPCTRRHSHVHGHGHAHSDAAFSTDMSSSLPSDEMPQLPASTAAWWDNLGLMSEPSEVGGVTDDEFMGGGGSML